MRIPNPPHSASESPQLSDRLVGAIRRAALCGALFLAAADATAVDSPAAPSGLRAAVARIDLTPDQPKKLLGYAARQSTGVLDRIHHRILVLDDGATRFFLVSSEFCVMSPALYDRVAGRLERDHGIPRANFWWTLTHTHSAPEVGAPGLPAVFMAERYDHRVDEEYTAFVENTLVDGVADALRCLEPVRLGAGWGHANANINRRARAPNGTTRLGMNPDGPVDRRIGVLRLDRPDGTPLALVANYPIHGTVLNGKNQLISGDAPGVVSTYVEKKSGAVVLFINGAAGNLAPIYSVQPTPQLGHLDEYELLLGDRILAAANAIGWRPETVQLRVGESWVETPRREGLGWPDELGAYTRPGPDGRPLVRIPVRFLRINREVAIWGAPLELFCEISNEVRERSPFLFTFYYGYLNGWLGYLPTEREFALGGYEPRTSPYTPAAEAHFRAGVLGYLEGELRR
jgi:neutral ceramidase